MKNKPFSTYDDCFWSLLVTFVPSCWVLIQFNFNSWCGTAPRSSGSKVEVVKKTVPEEKVILESQVLL